MNYVCVEEESHDRWPRQELAINKCYKKLSFFSEMLFLL